MTRHTQTRATILTLVLRGHATSRPPSYRELCAATGTTIRNVEHHLATLRRAGLVMWDDGKCRTLRPTCRVEVLS